MFSVAEKRQIAEAVEKVLLDIGHPEMPKEKPKFKLHVDGAQSWSWADIEPNWVYDDGQKTPGVNPWNEQSKDAIEEQVPVMNEKAKELDSKE